MYSISIAAEKRRSGEINEDQTVHIGMLVRPLSLSLCSVALAQEGGGAVEEAAETALPANLNTGQNIPFWGGGTGWYLAAGKNPYNKTRLEALLPASQWSKIRTPFTPEDPEDYVGNHFDHVRLPLDPRLFFADTTGSFPVSSHQDHQASIDNMDAVVTQCERARTAGLAVILDLHPSWYSSDEYDHIVGIWDADPANDGITFQTTYGGPWKLDMVTYSSSQSSWDNHPLVKWWNDFMYLFRTRYLEKTGHLPPYGDIYFEIMNEPNVDIPSGYVDQGTMTWHAFLVSVAAQWRTVQAHVIQKIQSIDSGATVIATTALSDPRDLAGWRPLKWDLPTDPSYTAFGNAYSSSGDNITHADKIIYNLHLYFPVRFTDFKRWFPGLADPNYYYERDFLGEGIYDPEGRDYPADDTTVGGWYNDDCIDTIITKVSTWRHAGNNQSAIMFTELGTQTRHEIYQDPGHESNPNYTGGDDNNNFRGQWMFNVRTRMRQQGFGFTIWDYCGGFRIWDRYTTLWDPNNFQSFGSQGSLLPSAREGLFGVTSP